MWSGDVVSNLDILRDKDYMTTIVEEIKNSNVDWDKLESEIESSKKEPTGLIERNPYDMRYSRQFTL